MLIHVEFTLLLGSIIWFLLCAVSHSRLIRYLLSTRMQAVEAAGIYDHDSNCKFDLALARNSWRVRAQKLLQPSLKPTLQQIQRHLKEVLPVLLTHSREVPFIWFIALSLSLFLSPHTHIKQISYSSQIKGLSDGVYVSGFCYQHTIRRLLQGKTYGSEVSVHAVGGQGQEGSRYCSLI